ncbi:hypothetical protein QUF80_17010 [Desulfococcaceae bacterium HSG8]|nr:hypothetical protein [Desulfococcaceae bacterium HSG8]
MFFLLLAVLAGTVVFFYFTNEGVATELRQVRQPNPNLFYVGIDVSATIDADLLNDFKKNVVARLKNFIGDEAVSYNVSTFGNPGCGDTSVKGIVPKKDAKYVLKKSPADPTVFKYEVEDEIQGVSAAREPEAGKPLTTPLHHFLEQVLAKKSGGRVIIFSDVMNDDSDCTRQYPFPGRAVTKFGADKSGQLVFLYPTPPLTNTPELNERILKRQQEFIKKMEKLRTDGKVRAFFYHIPDDPGKRSGFMESQLQNSIPTTTFEIVWERASKMIDTIVSAVRG